MGQRENFFLPVFWLRAFDAWEHGWKQHVLSWLWYFTCETATLESSVRKALFLKALNLTCSSNLQGKFFLCKLNPTEECWKVWKKPNPKNIHCLRGCVIALQQSFWFQAKHLPNFLPLSHCALPFPALIRSLILLYFCLWYLERITECQKFYLITAGLDFTVKVSWGSADFKEYS